MHDATKIRYLQISSKIFTSQDTILVRSGIASLRWLNLFLERYFAKLILITYWLRNLRPNDPEDVRILTYGYDSHISHFFNDPAHQINIPQHDEALLRSLFGEHLSSEVRGRLMIFVAHGLGGLNAKELGLSRISINNT